MVSAAKLRKAQDAITRMRPYAIKLHEILGGLGQDLANSESPYTRQGEVNNVLIIAISSNRGLCGAFNSQVIKRVNKLITADYADKNVTVLTFGKKAEDAFRKTTYYIKGTLLPRHTNEIYDHLDYEHVAAAARKIMDAFADHQFDKVVLVYNSFKNAASQYVVDETMLPMAPAQSTDHKQSDFIYEPSKPEILSQLIPKSIKAQLYKALLDSVAAEHGARMTAMHKATDNASEMLKELKLTYNKARQASITKEILEIVGGAEALKG